MIPWVRLMRINVGEIIEHPDGVSKPPLEELHTEGHLRVVIRITTI
jgi:hypothetical protein